MRWKIFLTGLLLVVAAPLLVLLAFAAWVHVANAGAWTGPLVTTVHPQVVLPWQHAAYLFTAQRSSDATPALPEPIDVVFLVDVSGSMTGSLPAMARAAHAVAREMSEAGDLRFALVRFDTEAEVDTPWTTDPEELGGGLEGLDAFTHQNDTRAAFARLSELVAAARPDARMVAVWYTDGGLEACPPSVCTSVMSESEIVAASERLRRDAGLEHFAIGLPAIDAHPLLIRMTGSPARVFEPADARDLARTFRSMAGTVITGLGDKGRVSVKLDGRHFATPLEGTDWQQGGDGTLRLDAGIRADRAFTYALPLKPRSAGLWRVGLEPARLAYVDSEIGSLVEAEAERRPSLLVVTWLALFWALMPALVWALAQWPRRQRPEEQEPLVLPPVLRQPAPARLPALPPAAEARRAAVPTLFIGLGGAGRRALYAVRSELKEAHLGADDSPYLFQCIDVDARQAEYEPAFDDWPGYAVEALVASPEIARTASYMPSPGDVPERWSWFDAERYHDAPREDLNLADGARGDRCLARLAFFRWLEKGGLAGELRRASEQLAELRSSDGCRQVVIFASRDGGFGSGVFLDIGRLMQRLGRNLQAGNTLSLPPEVVGVVCDDADRAHPENHDALELEIRTAMLAGAYPSRTRYAESDPLLDRTDSETPYHQILSVSGPDALSTAAQCAETSAALTERRPRRAVLEAAAELDDPDETGSQDVTSRVIASRTSSLHVIPTLIREQVGLELLLRLLGPDVLLDIEPAPGGGFVPAVLPEAEASRRLADWAVNEPATTPLGLLLQAVQDPAALPAVAAALERAGDGAGDWLRAALTAAVNRRLQGHRDGAAWHRDWQPAAASAILGLLGRRLNDGLPAFERAGAGEPQQRCWTLAGETATALAGALADQAEAFSRSVEQIAERRHQLADRIKRFDAVQGRTVLDVNERRAEIESQSRQALERWLGSCDTVSLLRERLFFGLVDNAPRMRAVVHSHVGPAAVFESAEGAVEALEELTQSLVAGLPAARLASALARRDPDRRRVLAAGLVSRDSRPQRVVLVTPQPSAGREGDGPREARALEEFRRQVPQPADHGQRHEARSADLSAVRRVELERRLVSPASGSGCAAPADREAERQRQRIERAYRLDVPPLPPALRLALTRPLAFRSFARAYRAGRVLRRRDGAGRQQWYFLDRGLFLTHGEHDDLAAAAIGYTANVDDPEENFPVHAPAGDFSALETWRREAGAVNDDVLVQAAIDCAP